MLPEHPEHGDDLVKGGFIDVPAGPCIGKTEITVQVAPVGKVDVCQEGAGFVVRTQTTVFRATPLQSGDIGVLNAPPDGFERLKLVP